MIRSVETIDVNDKFVLFRPDINSPIDEKGNIKNFNRINQTIPTLSYLLNNGAKVAIIAHQGDVLDYQNLMPLEEHAKVLSKLLNKKIEYIDDVCGDYALERIKTINKGEAVILGNLRYLAEEMSSFENYVKLDEKQMSRVYLIRRLAPLFDIYVNDAFAAAHREAPSMTGFQKYLESVAGFLFFKEYSNLSKVMNNPNRPVVFIFGGAKVSDSFSIMNKILEDKVADKILTAGLLAQLMLLASGKNLGARTKKFLEDKNILQYLGEAKNILAKYKEKILLPIDFAYEKNGDRQEVLVDNLPIEIDILDIGHSSVSLYKEEILKAKTIFYNGPAGVYEKDLFKYGTQSIFEAIVKSEAYSLIGGGDTVTAANAFVDISKFGYVSTAGGAMIQFLSGSKLPLIKAMEESKNKDK